MSHLFSRNTPPSGRLLPPLGQRVSVLLLFLLLAFMSAGRPAMAQNSAPRVTGIRVGIAGAWKAGFITPVFLYVDGLDAGGRYTLELRSIDSDKTPTFVRSDFSYEGADRPVYGRCILGHASADLEAAVFDASGETLLCSRKISPSKVSFLRGAKQAAVSGQEENPKESDAASPAAPNVSEDLFLGPVPSDRPLWVITGDPNNGLAEAAAFSQPEERLRPVICRVDYFDDLATDRLGYDAADILFLSASREDFYPDADTPAAGTRVSAIDSWVASGGRLVVSGGSQSLQRLLPGGTLASLIPAAALPDMRELRVANSLVQYVPKAKNLIMTGNGNNPFLTVPVLDVKNSDRPADTMVDFTEGDVPMVVRQIRGFGTVTFFAGECAEQPLRGWSGRDRLWLGILGHKSEHDTAARQGSASLMELGYTDLSGQMRSALDRFEGVNNFPFSLILILAGLYILVIGPLDWFLTHRLFRRPNLTWLTFPIWLVLFSLIALSLGRKTWSHAGRSNLAEIIDIDQTSASVRGSVWAGFYSPADDLYSLAIKPSFSPSAQVSEVLFNPLALSGSGLGATEQKSLSVAYWDLPYENLRLDGLVAPLPVAVRASKSLFGEWYARAEIPQVADLKYTASDLVTGSVTNPFGQTLNNAILFCGKWAYNIGTLQPNETFTIDRWTLRLDPPRALTNLDSSLDQPLSNTMTQSSLEQYDTQSSDPAYIMRALMFFDMAGGSTEIGLCDERHRRIDGSELLRCGRAVLIGCFDNEQSGQSEPRTDFYLGTSDASDRVSASHPVCVRVFSPVREKEEEGK